MSSPLPVGDAPLQILLVEDNPGDARLVEAGLKDGLDVDFELLRVARLEEGARTLGERTVDLVLLDLNLPDASGLDTIQGIQSVGSDSPVVVLTGLDDEETALRALRHGVQDYLAKDRMSPDTLRRVVRYSLERHRTARQLDVARRTSSRLTAILEATPDFVAMTDPEGHIQWINGPGKELVGLPADRDLTDEPLDSFQPEWAVEILREEGLPRAIEEGSWRGETALLTRDGDEIPVSQIILAHSGDDGGVEYLSTIMRDISEAKQREEELRRSEERLQRVLETIVEGLCITDDQGTIVFANEGAERILEVPTEKLVGRPATDEALSRGRWRRHAPDGDTRQREEMAVHQVLDTGEPVHGVEHVLKRPEGDAKVISVNAAPLRGPGGGTEGVVVSLRDVTRQRQFEEELERKALYDQVTGLPNRSLFFDRLEQASARAVREGDQFAILFVDLDGFKAVNDTLGHAAGDRVLRRVGERIRGCFREEDTVARMGGDEFTVLLEGFDGTEGLRVVIDRLTESLDPPHRIQGEDIRVPASVGVVLGEGEEDPDELVRRADEAMYHVKQKGGHGHHFFTAGDEPGHSRRARREARLQEGVRRREFMLHYQPVVDLASDEVHGVEALPRWHHPDRGLLLPGEFVDLAEETGLAADLAAHLLRQACHTVAGWQEDGATPLFFALPAGHLESSGLIPVLSGALDETALPPDLLRLQVDERLVMQPSDPVSALAELGVGVYVDDVGLGPSSLSRLREIEIDGMKMDRSITAGLGGSPRDEALARTILAFSTSMGLDVVAEGIERKEQRDRLLELGGRLGQGTRVARPMGPDELDRWRQERRR